MKKTGAPELNDATIDIYQDRRQRWRWRFNIYREFGWDTQAVSSDSFKTAGEAELNATHIVCTAWSAPTECFTRTSVFERIMNFIFGKK